MHRLGHILAHAYARVLCVPTCGHVLVGNGVCAVLCVLLMCLHVCVSEKN